MNDYILKRLNDSKEEKYKAFQEKLLPGVNNILGVRIPILRKLAAELVKGNWQEVVMDKHKDMYFEETMLRGLVIGKLKVSPQEHINLIKGFLPLINNWAVCDSFCTSLKAISKYPDEYFQFVSECTNSKEEFVSRFGAVVLSDHYINDAYIDRTISLLNNQNNDTYYYNMAQAWALSMCYVKYPDKIESILKSNNLNEFTYKKTVQKIIESNKVSKDTKEYIKAKYRKNTL